MRVNRSHMVNVTKVIYINKRNERDYVLWLKEFTGRPTRTTSPD